MFSLDTGLHFPAHNFHCAQNRQQSAETPFFAFDIIILTRKPSAVFSFSFCSKLGSFSYFPNMLSSPDSSSVCSLLQPLSRLCKQHLLSSTKTLECLKSQDGVPQSRLLESSIYPKTVSAWWLQGHSTAPSWRVEQYSWDFTTAEYHNLSYLSS